MLIPKKIIGLMLAVFIIQLNLFFLSQRLMAQTNLFHLGIYNYDVGGAEHTLDEPNEIANIDGLHLNYLSEMSFQAQPGMIDFCSSRNGAIRTALSHDDPTGGYYYPVYDYNPYRYNTMLWRYISDNEFQHIKMDSVVTFINRVYNRYQTNHIGIGAIRVAHQGCMDQVDHFDFIRRAGHRIQQLFGDDVQSMVTHNIFHWDGGTSLSDFFSYMDDSLDIYQHEEYPFHVHNTGPDPLHPTAYAPFCGWNYQDWQIDTLILGSYDLTRNELIKGQGQNPHTRLEVIIQTQRDYYPATQTFVRRPTESEIWLQAFLALSRGYKGIYSYVYRTTQTGNSWGLVDERTPRQQCIDSLCYYQNNPNNYNRNTYAVVEQLYAHLNSLGPQIMPLNLNEAFTWKGTAHQYIQEITGDALDGNHRTIEVAIFNPIVNGQTFDYFMVVNRLCSSDNNGTVAPPQIITVRTNKTGQYQIRDLYSGELFVSSNGYFRNITIGPGRGRVFELRQMFVSNESWKTNTVNVSSNITVPTGKTLTITENSIIKFYANTQLITNGTLAAVGSDANHLTFTSEKIYPAAGDWKGIRLASGSSASVLKYCDILYTMKAISIDYSSPIIQYNTIRYFSEQGIYTNTNASPQILNNLITNGGLQGIYHVSNGGTPTIQNNIIGTIGDAMTYGFERYQGGSSTTTFQNNTIRYTSNSGAAIKVSYATVVIVNNTITNNSGHGIWVKTSGNPDIHDNDINDNGKSGIYVEQGSPTNIKWNNILRNQIHGIHLLRTCDSQYFKTMMQDKWNNIFGNSNSEINNQQKSVKLMAENQFWSSDNASFIKREMKGNVDFDPWQTTANPDAGPGGGISKFIAEELLPRENLVSLPQEFSLSQNFPNPFNPETALAYALPTQAHVTLKIFNMLGEEIMILCGKQQQAGLYQLTWNGKNKFGEAVPSGVYFYRLEAQPGDKTWTPFVTTRKMLCVK